MLRVLTAAVLSFPLLAAGAAVAGPAQEFEPKVSATTFVLRGRGYGHGVGMGQWGAFGQAKRGVTYDAILAHYYPGTTLTRARPERIRVLLAEGSGPYTVSSKVAFRVIDGAGETHRLESGSYRVGQTFVLAADPTAAPVALKGPLTFVPGSEPLALRGKPYRGSFVLQRVGGVLQAVNVVGLDPYVRGVVTEEVPEDWPLEAIKAQAVAARSYALAAFEGRSILYADTRGQVYSGIHGESKPGDRAVAATRGQVLTFDGKVATAFFYSSSGGRTADVRDVFVGAKSIPYLVSVADPDDKVSPYHRWGPVVFSAARVSALLGVAGASDIHAVPAAGRTREVAVTGRAGQKRIRPSAVRTALGLRSAWIEPGVLTLARPAKPLLPGEAASLTGVARRVKGPIRVQQRLSGVWETLGAVTPGSDGSFALEIAPTATARYRLAAADGVVSSSLQVPVAG